MSCSRGQWYRRQVETCSVRTAYKLAVGKGNYNIGGSDVEGNIGIGQGYEIAGSSRIGINGMGGR